ncbi:MAG: outer membrane beta-barrel protein [Candidatus Lambdaproteobacteria bacterium]|nr:outer membrane beta-barrel protein [Candidatus Lambdaproteobacteria bacterium]
MSLRPYSPAVRLLLLTACAVALAASLHAAQGDLRGELFIGSNSFATKDASTYGSIFGFNWGYEFEPEVLWTLTAAYSSTDGHKVVAGQSYPISARTSTAQTGLLRYFNRGPANIVAPFLGGGFSVLYYEIDFNYPESVIGTTAGTGYGVFAMAGAEIRLSRSTTLIPQYRVTSHQIQAQSGRGATLYSVGLLIALRIGI